MNNANTGLIQRLFKEVNAANYLDQCFSNFSVI